LSGVSALTAFLLHLLSPESRSAAASAVSPSAVVFEVSPILEAEIREIASSLDVAE
jgi:hypothetical protein